LDVTRQEEWNEECPRERESEETPRAPDEEPRNTAKVSTEPIAYVEHDEMECAEKQWVHRWIGGNYRYGDGGIDGLYGT